MICRITCEERQEESLVIQRHHLDCNNHVNNGQYIKIAGAYLSEGFEIKQMRAEYRKQAYLGNELFPYIYESEDKITVSHGMLDFGKLTPALSRFNMMGMTMKINDATADYSNAIAKVRINSSGKVEYGTWLYDALCLMNVTGKYTFIPELSLEYDMMMDVSCTMTLGGGF